MDAINDSVVPNCKKYGRLDQNPSGRVVYVYFLLVAMLQCNTLFPALLVPEPLSEASILSTQKSWKKPGYVYKHTNIHKLTCSSLTLLALDEINPKQSVKGEQNDVLANFMKASRQKGKEIIEQV